MLFMGKKKELCSLLFTIIYLRWSNYWFGSCAFISTKSLRLRTHRSWLGVLECKPASVVQHSIYYGHFLPTQHPNHFLLPPCLQDALQTVEPVWPAALVQPGAQLPGTQGHSSCLCPALPTALAWGQPTAWKNMHSFYAEPQFNWEPERCRSGFSAWEP